MRVRSLHVYPVKGARGITLTRAEVLAQGLRHDRRFLVIDEQERAFVTQREHPRMALVETAFTTDGQRLTLSVSPIGAEAGASRKSVSIDLTHSLLTDLPFRRVKIWDDEVDAVDVGGEGAAFFSEHLGRPCSLVYMPFEVIRPVEEPYAQPGDRLGFADAYPVLIASLGSLGDLNKRLMAAGASPVPMDRFRPNIVVGGDDDVAWAEEKTPTITVGSLLLRTPKRCSRCEVVLVDQQTAATSKEPLKTLASFRIEANKVYFAMNAIPEVANDASVEIAVGDLVTYEQPPASIR